VNEDEYLESEISLYRFNHLMMQNAVKFASLLKNFKFQPDTMELFPKSSRSYEEVYSGLLCEDLLGSYDLREEVLGITVSEWLRAFSIITESGLAFIKSKSIENSLTVENWCMIRDKKEWIYEFVKGGILAEKARIIIDNLIFNHESEDIIDCPFIQFEDKLLCLPSAITHLDAAQSLLSNFSKKNIDISFKGKKFEDDSIKIVKNAGIPAFKLHEINKNQEYECDLVFLIFEELYFVECKSFIQPRKASEYYGLLVKAYDASKQLSRIARHFLERSNLLNSKFNKPSDWCPTKVHKIVLSKANITPIFMNESFILDFSTFIRFFQREKVAIMRGDSKIAVIDDPSLDGPVTNAKFIDYIKNAIHIELIKNNRIKKEISIKMCNFIVKFARYEEKIPFFNFYEEKQH
jgi:hypothetical protein